MVWNNYTVKNILKHSISEKTTSCPFWNGPIPFGKERKRRVVMKYDVSLPKKCFHCLSEANHIVNENLFVPKMDRSISEKALVALSETECFRIFFQCWIEQLLFSFCQKNQP